MNATHTPTISELEERLVELEVKASFTEDLLDTLNDTIARQQQQIELLSRELLRLRDQWSDPGPQGVRNPRDEIPPHY